nr:pre-mRNA-splicing factor SLU7-A-like [Ipomoea batatas]
MANAVAFKSREDHRKQLELEEARKAGLAPAEVDEDGKEINPHIPQYMSSAPWYLNAERPKYLKEQQLKKLEEKNNNNQNKEGDASDDDDDDDEDLEDALKVDEAKVDESNQMDFAKVEKRVRTTGGGSTGTAAPSQAELLHKNYKINKEKLKSKTKETIMEKYGNAANDEALPRELLLGQSEREVEYDRAGRIVKGQVIFELTLYEFLIESTMHFTSIHIMESTHLSNTTPVPHILCVKDLAKTCVRLSH